MFKMSHKLVALLAMTGAVFGQAKPAHAVVGIVIAASAKNPGTQSVGDVLIALGAGTAIYGDVSGHNETDICTPTNPCDRGYDTEQGPEGGCPYGDIQAPAGTCDRAQDTGTQNRRTVNGTLITVGLVMLGTDASIQPELSPISKADAISMGISDKQLTAFDANLDQVNEIMGSLVSNDANLARLGVKSAARQQAMNQMIDEQVKPSLGEDVSGALKIYSAYLAASMKN